MRERSLLNRPLVVLLSLELSSIAAVLSVIMPVYAGLNTPQGGGRTSQRLHECLLRGALVELEEIGTNLSIAALKAAIEDPDRQVALAGIAAARSARDGISLLSPLARQALASAPDVSAARSSVRPVVRFVDRPVAAAAAQVATDIVRQLDAQRVVADDIALDEVDEPLRHWRAVAEADGLWADVRVQALDVVVALARLRGDAASGFDLSSMLRDPEPEVRRAALELAPASALSADVRTTVVDVLVNDPQPQVALAAAQALCSNASDASSVSARDATQRLPGEPALARIAELVLQDGLSPAGLLDAARCLARERSPRSARALRALSERGPREIRAFLRALRAP